jgi:hypothetical protein
MFPPVLNLYIRGKYVLPLQSVIMEKICPTLAIIIMEKICSTLTVYNYVEDLFYLGNL